MSADNGTATLLSPLGLSGPEEKIYRSLLRRGGGPLAEVVEATGLSERAARAGLASLEQKGLLGRATARSKVYVAAPPQAAVEILILRRQEELEEARLAIFELLAEAGREASGPDPTDIVEVVTGPGAQARSHQLLMGAQREILGFIVPPIFPADEHYLNFKLDILERGVKGKVVYTPEVLETPGVIAFIEAVRHAGEEPRVSSQLPTFLLIVDRNVACIRGRSAKSDKQEANKGCLVINPSGLLDALVALFLRVWDEATPFEPGGPLAEPLAPKDEGLFSPEENRVLAMLGAGMQDKTIAAQLGIGERSVQRHIRRVMDLLGTKTRFQTGMEAARRGLLGTSAEPAKHSSP